MSTTGSDVLTLSDAVPLRSYSWECNELSVSARTDIIDQAIDILENFYVHMAQKRAAFGIDVLQQLRLLRQYVATEHQIKPMHVFNRQLLGIFRSLRDLHTIYKLSFAEQGIAVFLPFLVESFFENGVRHYVASNVLETACDDAFVPGVEVLYLNGAPVKAVIGALAERTGGSNDAARRARGEIYLTIRPVLALPPPDEHWVVVRFRTSAGEEKERQFDWRVGGVPAGLSAKQKIEAAFGIDEQLQAVHRVRKNLFAPNVVMAERLVADTANAAAANKEDLPCALPQIFSARRVYSDNVYYGYLRVRSFAAAPELFFSEFASLLTRLPQNGLIIDLRDNAGGNIISAEMSLQSLTAKPILPMQFQFLNSPATLILCSDPSVSQAIASDLTPWRESILRAIETGATHSVGHPITPQETLSNVEQKYFGPIVLIVNGLCYSAADVFAASFQDHGVGVVLGTDDATGAGGANGWSLSMLAHIMPEGSYRPSRLANGVDISVAIRRAIRGGTNAGMLLENFGVVPDEIHQMTRGDVISHNQDLISHAVQILSKLPRYAIKIKEQWAEKRFVGLCTTQGIDRIDVYLDGRPHASVDVNSGSARFEILLASAEDVIEFRGFHEQRLVLRVRKHAVRL